MIRGNTFIIAESHVVPDSLLGPGALEGDEAGRVSTLEHLEPSRRGRRRTEPSRRRRSKLAGTPARSCR